MEFNDGNQWHQLLNPNAQLAAGREMYAWRGSSARDGNMYVDTAHVRHRAMGMEFKGALIYQFVWANLSPEDQGQFFVDRVLGGGLQPHEMVCVDVEIGGGFGPGNAAYFTTRWLAYVEPRLDTRAWVYVPKRLSSALSVPVTADRIIWAPRYSGQVSRGVQPDWRHDVHQYTEVGFFPGAAAPGDANHTDLTVDAMLARCNPHGFPEPPHGEGR